MLVDGFCVDPKEIRKVWPRVAHLIRAAVMRTGLSDFQVVEDSILDGDALLWVACDGPKIEAAASTILERSNDRLACVVVACGGENMERWVSLLSKIETYAKQEGCTCTRIIGRRGWLRVLKDYSAAHVILEKAI